ncbi:hypothetical protein GQ53DRAFT_823581 [Thozetella sp. PMI_491]|nr:hypothetical protein GQ53DRAFT_823581 [Thozetella sp. PMI_491]
MDYAKPVFHYFSRLPPELRLQIYMLATPPRMVHIEEHLCPEETEMPFSHWDILEDDVNENAKEDGAEETILSYYDVYDGCICQEDEFWEGYSRFLATPWSWQLKIHPSFLFFQDTWRRALGGWRPVGKRQRTLDSYGFTTNSGKNFGRFAEPTGSGLTDIPIAWLMSEKPFLAWQFLRRSYLHSKAPIPALLHVCVESRATLVEEGYELAFPTRTCGPRTWFNSRRDFLYVDVPGYSNYAEAPEYLASDSVDGTSFNLGQILPDTLEKIKNIAIYGCPSWEEGWDRLALAISYFINLKEVLLVVRNLDMEEGHGHRPQSEWDQFMKKCKETVGENATWAWMKCEINSDCEDYWRSIPGASSYGCYPLEWMEDENLIEQLERRYDAHQWVPYNMLRSTKNWKDYFSLQTERIQEHIARFLDMQPQGRRLRGSFSTVEFTHVIVGREPLLLKLNEHRLDHLELGRKRGRMELQRSLARDERMVAEMERADELEIEAAMAQLEEIRALEQMEAAERAVELEIEAAIAQLREVQGLERTEVVVERAEEMELEAAIAQLEVLQELERMEAIERSREMELEAGIAELEDDITHEPVEAVEETANIPPR